MGKRTNINSTSPKNKKVGKVDLYSLIHTLATEKLPQNHPLQEVPSDPGTPILSNSTSLNNNNISPKLAGKKRKRHVIPTHETQDSAASTLLTTSKAEVGPSGEGLSISSRRQVGADHPGASPAKKRKQALTGNAPTSAAGSRAAVQEVDLLKGKKGPLADKARALKKERDALPITAGECHLLKACLLIVKQSVALGRGESCSPAVKGGATAECLQVRTPELWEQPHQTTYNE